VQDHLGVAALDHRGWVGVVAGVAVDQGEQGVGAAGGDPVRGRARCLLPGALVQVLRRGRHRVGDPGGRR
jgi:hypothetical protein